jgi:hypothetical protein
MSSIRLVSPADGVCLASLSFCSSSSSASFAVLTLPLLRSRAPWLVAATIPDMLAPPLALTTLSRGQQRRELYVILLLAFPGFVFSFNQSVSQSINQACGSFLCVRASIAIAVLPESVADPCNVLIAPVIKH